MCNYAVIKNPSTRQVRSYTILWYVNVLKADSKSDYDRHKLSVPHS